MESSKSSMRSTMSTIAGNHVCFANENIVQRWRKDNHRRFMIGLVWFALFVVLVCGAIFSPLYALPLRGQVVDSVGSGVAGAVIELYEAKNGLLRYTITGDSSGVFLKLDITEMDYQIKVRSASFVDQWISRFGSTRYRQYITRIDAAATFDTLLLRVVAKPKSNPPTATIAVTVTDSFGALLTAPGSTVALLRQPDQVQVARGTVQQPSSVIVFDSLQASSYAIAVQAPGYPFQYYDSLHATTWPKTYLPLTTGDTNSVIMPLTTLPSGEGFMQGICYFPDSLPAENVTVTLCATADALPGLYSAKTDNNGMFSFDNLMDREYYLKIEAGNFPVQWFSRFRTETTYNPEDRIWPMQVVSDTVRIMIASVPFDNPLITRVTIAVRDQLGTVISLPGAVDLVDFTRNLSYSMLFDTASQTFILEEMATGDYAIKLDFAPYPIQFFMPAGNTQTDEYRFHLSASDNVFYTTTIVMIPRSSQGTTTAGFLTGTVHDSVGTLDGAMITVYDRNGSVIQTAVTTAGGRFPLMHIASQEVYVGIAAPPDFGLQYWSPQGMTTSLPSNGFFMIPADDTVRIAATMLRGGTSGTTGMQFTLQGTVSDEAGSPIAGARVVLFDFEPGDINPHYVWSPWVTVTDVHGFYLFDDIHRGVYRCMAENDTGNYVAQFYPKADFITNAEYVSIDETATLQPLDFILRKGSSVKGSVLTTAAKPVAGARVTMRSNFTKRWYETVCRSDGSYLLKGIPAGVWSIWADHEEYISVDNQHSEYSLIPQSTTAIPVFTMEAAGRVQGTYTIADLGSDTLGSAILQGDIAFFCDTVNAGGGTLWPCYRTGVELNPPIYGSKTGAFVSRVVKKGTYRMLFTPAPRSWEANMTTDTASLRPGLGFSFFGSATTLSASPVVAVVPLDTVRNLSMQLRRGYSVFGRLQGENGSLPATDYGVEVFVKQGGEYVWVGTAATLRDGRFELAGLIDTTNYFVKVWAAGYPHQYWSPADHATMPLSPWYFDAAAFTELTITIVQDPIGVNAPDMNGPISLWIENDSLGMPLLRWKNNPSNPLTSFVLYGYNRMGTITPLTTLQSTSGTEPMQFRDLRTSSGWREYVVVGSGSSQVIRSNVVGYDARSSLAGSESLWLDLFADRYGIRLAWGGTAAKGLAESDSVDVFRSVGAEPAKRIFRRPARENWIDDYTWDRADSGSIYRYYVTLVSSQCSSPQKSILLDRQFFLSLPGNLRVGPYETYHTIGAAILAAKDFDNIEVRAGTYNEQLDFGGKRLSLQGNWEFGKPPVIDGAGKTGVTIPFGSAEGNPWDRSRISGFIIRNCTVGISARYHVDVEACLFDNVGIALSLVIDSVAMVEQMRKNPFAPSQIEGQMRHCTAVAKKTGDLLATASARGLSEQADYQGLYDGMEQFIISPAVSLRSFIRIERTSCAFYHSRGQLSSLPVTLTGRSATVEIANCNFYQTSVAARSTAIRLSDKILQLDPQFSDSTTFFIAATSPLAAPDYDAWIGYDAQRSSPGSGNPDGAQPSAVTQFSSRMVGLNAVFLSWKPSPVDEQVDHYRIYRIPGDPKLFYVNQQLQWDITITEDSLFAIAESFSTKQTAFLDTTTLVGKPYLYVVVAINDKGVEGTVNLPVSPAITTYFTNVLPEKKTFTAGIWYLLGTMGADATVLPPSSKHVCYGWDDTRAADKLFSQYFKTNQLKSTGGYWFKPTVDTVLTIKSASIAALKPVERTVGATLVKAETGWNCISSPFPFETKPPWLSSYTAWEWNPDSMGYKQAKTLRPWQGYWVFADSDTLLCLWERLPLSSYVGSVLAKKTSVASWEMRLTLRGVGVWDVDNFIGVIPRLLAKTGVMSAPEPPVAFGGSQLFIVNDAERAVGTAARKMAKQYRVADPLPKEKLSWLVGIGPSPNKLIVGIEGVAALPEGLFAFWVDQHGAIDLRKQQSFPVASGTSTTYGYIVVTPNSKDIAFYRSDLKLAMPYPNPFRGSATIEYVLPYLWNTLGVGGVEQVQPLTIVVFDIAGKKVKTLVQGKRGPGVYRTIWDGNTSRGTQIPAGMYIIRLQYGDKRTLLKVFRMQ